MSKIKKCVIEILLAMARGVALAAAFFLIIFAAALFVSSASDLIRDTCSIDDNREVVCNFSE